ncbi:hypothetical protein [Latilactobacillus sakei]|uniref:hypothetical protein n=1 Tax=Latilactobacillus sakei TaxID=1599 RepID=UPI00338EA5C3
MDYGNLADWVSATATFIATGSALYLSARKPKPKIFFRDYKSGDNMCLIAVNAGNQQAQLSIGPLYINEERKKTSQFVGYKLKDVVAAPGNIKTEILVTLPLKISGNVIFMVFNNSTGERYDIYIEFTNGEYNIKKVKTVNLIKKLLKENGYNRR